MKISDFIAAQLQGSLQFLHMTIADMSDADLMTRPVPTANHANWQIGHLIVAETNLMNAVGAKMPELPAGFADKYKKETASIDDAGKFLKKDELMGLFGKTRAATIAFTKSLSSEQLAAPGPEKFKDFAPTVASMADMQNGHIQMHLGQLQVLRRKLGKPILF